MNQRELERQIEQVARPLANRHGVVMVTNALRNVAMNLNGEIETTEQLVVYSAPGLDGAVHRTTAEAETWNVEVARGVATADLQERNGSIPCELSEISIIDIRDP